MERIYCSGYDHRSKEMNNQKAVIQLDLDGTELQKYKSMAHASNITGVSYMSISKCLSKRSPNKTAGGYKWKYKL